MARILFVIVKIYGTNSNVIMYETKYFFSIFFSISEIYIKFSTFWKNKWSS